MLPIDVVECDEGFEFYHNGKAKENNRQHNLAKRAEKRLAAPVIAWDGEGIDLRGPGKPQSYVLFGCSAEVDSPLIIKSPDQCLGYREILDYICNVGSRNPGAIHVGYGFGYDQNMIIQKMPLEWKQLLKEGKAVVYYEGTSKKTKYRVKINWQKRLEVTRTRPNEKVTVRIDDIAAFFHAKFTEAYRSLCGNSSGIVTEGKAQRGSNTWDDLPEILRYWQAEIVELSELASRFRGIMYDAGFLLSDWYGPGALANYLRRTEKLAEHEWGAKEENIPKEVHAAAKSAFYGGRFEQFLLGRIEGPVYSLDINSAYPAAFCEVPTLKEGGFWRYVNLPSVGADTFGVYYIRYCDPDWVDMRYRIPKRSLPFQPLPYRDDNGQISYPPIVEGWYWRPEVEAVRDCFPNKVEIVEGWEWVPADDSHPWRDVMGRMFAARKELKKAGSPTQLAYKLAINSMYGKAAQRVGWDKENRKPPKSHSLAIAGYITSHCRASLLRVMSQLGTRELIAVETDGIYFTGAKPDTLSLPTGMGSDLGQWELEQFDEMMYVQNGVYLARQSQDWVKTKSRGFSSNLVSPESITDFLRSLTAMGWWKPLKMPPVSKFIGIGLALQMGRNSQGSLSAAKVNAVHCQWVKEEREIDAEGKGKRRHIPGFCDECEAGFNTYERPHSLYSNHGKHKQVLSYALSYGKGDVPTWNPVSQSYKLPWETTSLENWREQQEADDEYLEREYEKISASLHDSL